MSWSDRVLSAIAGMVAAACAGTSSENRLEADCPAATAPAPPSTPVASASAAAEEASSLSVERTLLTLVRSVAPGDPGVERTPPIRCELGNGGLALGAVDGTLAVQASIDRPPRMLGLPGRIVGIVALPTGDLVVRAGAHLARVRRDGTVRWLVAVHRRAANRREFLLARETTEGVVVASLDHGGALIAVAADGTVLGSGPLTNRDFDIGQDGASVSGAPAAIEQLEVRAESGRPVVSYVTVAHAGQGGELRRSRTVVLGAAPEVRTEPSWLRRRLLAFDAQHVSLVPGASGEVYVARSSELWRCDHVRCRSLRRFPETRASAVPHGELAAVPALVFSTLGSDGAGGLYGYGYRSRGYDATTSLWDATLAVFRFAAGGWQPAPQVARSAVGFRDLSVLTTQRGTPALCGRTVDGTWSCGVKRGRKWATVQLEENWIEGIVRSGNDLYAFGGAALWQLQGDGFVAVENPAHERLSAIASQRAGELWAVADDQWLYHLDGGSWTPMSLPLERGNDVDVVDAGDVWVAGYDGVARWDGARWGVAGTDAPAWRVVADPGGAWVAASDGLWFFERGTDSPVFEATPAPPPAAGLPPSVAALATEPPSAASREALAALTANAAASSAVLARVSVGRAAPCLELGPDHFATLPPGDYLAGSQLGQDVWLAGGAFGVPLEWNDASHTLTLGEGVVAHRSGQGTKWHRVPMGVQLAVLAVGPDEAWSAGAGGSVVHFTGQRRQDWRVGPCWMRRLWARAPDDVWIAGDGPTLLHWNGRALRGVSLPNSAEAGPGSRRCRAW